MVNEELVDEWFKFAASDFNTAKYLFENMHPAPLEIVCYHCQQSAEKYTKGILVGFDEMPEKTHDIFKVLNALRKYLEIPADFPDLANNLSLFATKTRYPQEFSIDESQARNAILQAEKIKAWAENIIAQNQNQ